MELLPAFAKSAVHTIEDFTDKVLCMDALELLRLLPDASVDMVLCDLPYGVTDFTWDVVIPMQPLWEQLRRIIKPCGAIVLTATEPFASQLRISALDLYRDDYIYQKVVKTRFLDAKRRPLLAHEYVLIFGKQLPQYYPQMKEGQVRAHRRQGGVPHYVRDKQLQRVDTNNNGEFYPTTLLPKFYDHERHDSVTQKDIRLHPTQKPLELFEYLIKTYTKEGEIVLDMTCGSGTTAIAARKTGRHFICGDITPEYVELALRRLQNTDPFQDTVFSNGWKQLSLFGMMEVSDTPLRVPTGDV